MVITKKENVPCSSDKIRRDFRSLEALFETPDTFEQYVRIITSDTFQTRSPETHLSDQEIFELFNDIQFDEQREDIERRIAALRSAALAAEKRAARPKNAADNMDHQPKVFIKKISFLLRECTSSAILEGSCLVMMDLLAGTIGSLIGHLISTQGNDKKQMYTMLSLYTVLKSIHSKIAEPEAAEPEAAKLDTCRSMVLTPERDLTDEMLQALYRAMDRYSKDQFFLRMFKSTLYDSDTDLEEEWDRSMLDRHLGDFSVVVRNQRLKKNWTQAELAEISHVDRSMIAKIERLTACPTLETALKLLIALDLIPEIIDSTMPIHKEHA